MATSTCTKCGNQSFEVVSAHIRGAEIAMNFVQCVRCGGVVGVIEERDLAQMIDALAEGVFKIAQKLDVRL